MKVTMDQALTGLLVFVVSFLLAYCLGLNVIGVINQRLKNISINMPKIEVQPPVVNVQLDPRNGQITKTEGKPSQIPETHIQVGGGRRHHRQVGGNPNPATPWMPSVEPIKNTQPAWPLPRVPTRDVDDVGTQSTAETTAPKLQTNQITESCPSTKIGCQTNADCNKVYGNGLNQCHNGACTCVYGEGQFCQNQPNYYLDPSLMTPEQVIKFKNRAKLDRMTLTDYKNWLRLFKYDLDNLPLVHRKNYHRLLRGDSITEIPVMEADLEQNFPAPSGGRGPGGQIPGLPDDKRLYRMDGDRKLASAGLRPTEGDLVEVNMKIPNIEADTSHNYTFTDDHLDTTGYINTLGQTQDSLEWSNYQAAFQPNRKYVEYQDKVKPFKTTHVASWYQNSAIELSDLVEDTQFDPAFADMQK